MRLNAGSAEAGSDFRLRTYHLLFATGENSKTETFLIINDDVPEGNEILTIELIEADGEIDDDNKELIVTIIDDDGEEQSAPQS